VETTKRYIGNTDHCIMCGAEYIITGYAQKYCIHCSSKHWKEIHRAASLKYNKNNKEKIRQRRLDKKNSVGSVMLYEKCLWCGLPLPPDMQNFGACSEECIMWYAKLREFKQCT